MKSIKILLKVILIYSKNNLIIDILFSYLNQDFFKSSTDKISFFSDFSTIETLTSSP